MREIRFRGKRLGTGEWVLGDLIHSINGIIEIGIAYDDQYGKRYMRFEVDPATVGQFSGRKVRNNEVYQDDIGKSIDGLFLVVWDEEKAAFMMQYCDGERLCLEEMWDDSKIIGNIHDNPTLVQGGDER